MQCPVCTETQLVMTSRQDIEIDYCPKCRGVWLDRGELDKIIERSQREQPVVALQPQEPPRLWTWRGKTRELPQTAFRLTGRPAVAHGNHAVNRAPREPRLVR